MQFDSQGIDDVYNAVTLDKVAKLDLQPRGATPLLDALGQTLVKTGERLKAMAEDQRPGKVLFVIITDGEENSSREYKKTTIKEMIERQQNVYRWQFIFLGANVDAFAEAGSLGINLRGASNYTPDSAGVKSAFSAADASTRRYRGDMSAEAVVSLTDDERDAMGSSTPPKAQTPATPSSR